jgi:hypothetical protein
MKASYDLWLNGNSLVLVSGLSDEQAQGVLDVQLFAWLKARGEHSPFDDHERWQTLYQSSQTALGCVFVAADSRAINEQNVQPLQSLRMGLQPLLQSDEQRATEDCFDVLGSLRDSTALQALHSVAVLDGNGTRPNRICMELRLLMPGPRTRILSSQLDLHTSALIGHSWLWQAFASEERLRCTQQAHLYVFNQRLHESIKDDLDALLGGLRPRYQCKVPGIFQGAGKNE